MISAETARGLSQLYWNEIKSLTPYQKELYERLYDSFLNPMDQGETIQNLTFIDRPDSFEHWDELKDLIRRLTDAGYLIQITFYSKHNVWLRVNWETPSQRTRKILKDNG